MVRCRYSDAHGVRCTRDAGNNIYCERHKHFIEEIIATSVNICRVNGIDMEPVEHVYKELIYKEFFKAGAMSTHHSDITLHISDHVKRACLVKGVDMLQAAQISAVIVDTCIKYGIKAK